MRIMRLLETDRVPDWVIRAGIDAAVRWGLYRRYRTRIEARAESRREMVQRLRQSPIAIHTDDANEQHYEVPTAFFQTVLGRRLKYSCCHWPHEVSTLDQAEEAMLELTCQRAEIVDGMEILELGCGWGSLCLWMAEQYPAAQIVAVSNSATQKAYIDAQCATRQLDNVDVITANVADLRLERRFDRVVSIEMFEHLKNYGAMMARIAEMLRPDGRLFVHIFCHREFAYEFEADDPGDWMARTFFSGGTMPSSDLLLYFQDDLRLVDQWAVDGRHYARTLRAWLNKLDAHRQEVDEIMAATYGPDQATRQVVNWRLFFMVCEAIFRSRGGREWFVAHYLFAKS